MLKKLLIFDLDDTLTKSKAPLEADMRELLIQLLEKFAIVIISGGTLRQLQKQFVAYLDAPVRLLPHLYLAPTSGAILYAYKNNSWQVVYVHVFQRDEKEKIKNVMNKLFDNSKFMELTSHDALREFGPIIEDRESQITLSIFGMQAPVQLKSAWDKDRSKRNAIAAILRSKLPEFEVHTGGSTSIDVTLKGVNKGFALKEIEKNLNIPIRNMLFIGDALEEGGNDASVLETKIEACDVNSLEETKQLIRKILAAFSTRSS